MLTEVPALPVVSLVSDRLLGQACKEARRGSLSVRRVMRVCGNTSYDHNRMIGC